jgi:acetyltransferase
VRRSSGGIFVELLRDVSTQLAPVTAVTARRATESLRLHKILTGLRGDPATTSTNSSTL